jgi:hypothetical protein
MLSTSCMHVFSPSPFFEIAQATQRILAFIEYRIDLLLFLLTNIID